MKIGIVVGLVAEARLAAPLGSRTEIGGGGAEGAARAARTLIASGVDALLSFGLAGGLAPGVTAGTLVIPAEIVSAAGGCWLADAALAARLGGPEGALLAGTEIIVTRAAKAAAWLRTGALAVDLESGAVAQTAAAHGIPFAVLRAVCDPASRDLPPAALTALHPDGRVKPWALAGSLARHPGQIAALMALGREAALARRALLDRVARVGTLQ